MEGKDPEALLPSASYNHNLVDYFSGYNATRVPAHSSVHSSTADLHPDASRVKNLELHSNNNDSAAC